MTKKPLKTDELPKGVKPADLKRPKWEDALGYAKQQALGLDGSSGWPGSLRFYRTEKLGWVLCTLHISNPSRRQAAGTPARTYGIGVADGKIYTVGKGPHVLEEIEVYLTKANAERLAPLVDLWKKGMADAGGIRDRISSRRAQGQLYRSEGRTSWRW